MSEGTDLFESRDGGKTFSRIAEQFTSARIFDIEVAPDVLEPDGSQKIYVSSLGVGISRLIEYEPVYDWYQWQYLRKSPEYAYVFTVHPSDGNIFYAGQSPRIFENHASIFKYDANKGEDFGWSELVRFDGMKGVTALEIHQDNSNILYAGLTGTPGKLVISTDGGERWFEIMEGLDKQSEFYVLLIHPYRHDTLFLSTNRGVYMSKNAGATWIPVNEGLPTTFNQVRDNVAENLAFTADDNRYLLLTLVENGIWKAKLKELE